MQMTSFYMYVFDLKRRYWVFTVELINHNGCYTSAPHPVTDLDASRNSWGTAPVGIVRSAVISLTECLD